MSRSSQASLVPTTPGLTLDESVYGPTTYLELHLPPTSTATSSLESSYSNTLRKLLSGKKLPEPDRETEWEVSTQVEYKPDPSLTETSQIHHKLLPVLSTADGTLSFLHDDPGMRSSDDQSSNTSRVILKGGVVINSAILSSERPTNALDGFKGSIRFRSAVRDEQRDARSRILHLQPMPAPDINGNTMVKVRWECTETDVSSNGQWTSNWYDAGTMDVVLGTEANSEQATNSGSASTSHRDSKGKKRSHKEHHKLVALLGLRFSCSASSNPFQ